MSKPVMVRCSCCRGTGRVELTGECLATLCLLATRPGLNAAQLARVAGVKGSAMANRLVALERLGLAAGQRHGRQRLWRSVALGRVGS